MTPSNKGEALPVSLGKPLPANIARAIVADFVAIVAHEIRNILNPLVSSLELLNVRGLDEMSTLQAKEVTARQVRQLQRLVNDLLDMHRLERQQVELVLRSTDLRTVVEAICVDYRQIFASHGITLLRDVPAYAIRAEVDVDRLNQVLNNLLSNSLKFTDRGGSVHVALSMNAETEFAVISVRDTGMGIEPPALESIFDSYAHESSYRNRTGLGLGLPLAKRIVELHGGQLEAHSEGRGMGCDFRILLPLST